MAGLGQTRPLNAVREAWQDLFANLVFAECGLVLPKTEARSQATTSMMARPQTLGCYASSSYPRSLSRTVPEECLSPTVFRTEPALKLRDEGLDRRRKRSPG